MLNMMTCTMTYLRARFGSKKGQGMVEYGLIIGLVAVIIVACFTILSDPLQNLFTRVIGIVNGAGTSPSPSPAS